MHRLTALCALLIVLTTTTLGTLRAQLPSCAAITETAGRRGTWTSGNIIAGSEAYYDVRSTRTGSDCTVPTSSGTIVSPRRLSARVQAGATVSLLGRDTDIVTFLAQAYATEDDNVLEAQLTIRNLIFVPSSVSYSYRREDILSFRQMMPVVLVGAQQVFVFGPFWVTVNGSASALFSNNLVLTADATGVSLAGQSTTRVDGSASASLNVLNMVGVNLDCAFRLLDGSYSGQATVPWQGPVTGPVSAAFQGVTIRLDLCGWYVGGSSGCQNLVNDYTPRATYTLFP